MQNFFLKWLGPSLSQIEIEGLFSWLNILLQSQDHSPVFHLANLTILPRFEPCESMQIHFPLVFENSEAAESFRENLWNQLSTTPSDPFALSFVSEKTSKTKKRLVVFDVDSTFINEEVIDELARLYGVHDQIASLTEAAMHGQLDFKESLNTRLRLLQGMSLEEAHSVISQISESPGASAFVQFLKSQNTQTALVSGGFDFVLNHFQKKLLIDHIHAHHLSTNSQFELTGEVEAPIIDGAKKQKLVQEIKRKNSFTRDETVIIGDGSNDILMMTEAGVSVSFCGKPRLSEHVNTLIFDRNLLWTKYLL